MMIDFFRRKLAVNFRIGLHPGSLVWMRGPGRNRRAGKPRMFVRPRRWNEGER
jgi:hypothetical protein